MADEGELDPWVTQWFADNPERATPADVFAPGILELARGSFTIPVNREIAEVTDDSADGVRVRVYRNEDPPTGIVVYFHGGGFVVGSIDLMDNVARELAHATGAVVVSVEYRLAPENPYPAGLDDCEAVTRWALANAERLGSSADKVIVAGESAGGNLSAAVSLRLRDAGDVTLAGQVLLYPGVGGSREFPSMTEFDGLVLDHGSMDKFWGAYTAGRDLDDDPYAAPLSAPSLMGLPPALVVLGGCDLLRDEGRAYSARLGDEGVDVEEVCFAGQPHGFLNFDFPAAADAYAHVGAWVRNRLG